jgi:ParB-like chromosome segregation protein Spo0J
MQTHPAAELFPMLAEHQLKELADDIRDRGLLEPVWIVEHDGADVILDGRNRWQACVLAGVEPITRRYWVMIRLVFQFP